MDPEISTARTSWRSTWRSSEVWARSGTIATAGTNAAIANRRTRIRFSPSGAAWGTRAYRKRTSRAPDRGQPEGPWVSRPTAIAARKRNGTSRRARAMSPLLDERTHAADYHRQENRSTDRPQE